MPVLCVGRAQGAPELSLNRRNNASASINMKRALAFGFLARTQAIFRTDAPALTLPQVVDLLKAVLPKLDFDANAAIALLCYKQVRIASAKKSHFHRQKSKIIRPISVTQ